MHSGCGQANCTANDLRWRQCVVPGSATRSSFWTRKHATMGALLLFGGSLAHFNNLPGKIRLTTENNAQAENGDTSTVLACETDRNKPCHSPACPNLFVPRAETAALLINSCERGNDMQTLSTGDFCTKQRKYLWYNTHCLQVLAYHSLCEDVNLWKTIIEGKLYGNYAHTRSWLGSNRIYNSASKSWKMNCLSENSQFSEILSLLGKCQFLIHTIISLWNI